MVRTTCGSCSYSSCIFRPTRRLKSWSVPPISTSDFTITESYPWAMGYKNSATLIGWLLSYLFLKSSLSIILATVYLDEIRITCSKLILSNHSPLYLISVFSLLRILKTCSAYDLAFSLTSSMLSMGLVFDLPEGSPIRAVKSPIIRTI